MYGNGLVLFHSSLQLIVGFGGNHVPLGKDRGDPLVKIYHRLHVCDVLPIHNRDVRCHALIQNARAFHLFCSMIQPIHYPTHSPDFV